MPSADDSELWICIGEECGILLCNPNSLKFLITPRVTISKSYLPNYRDSKLKKFDPPIVDISLNSLMGNAIPWLLDIFGLNEEMVAAVLAAFNEVIDEGFAYKLEKPCFTETSKDEEILMYETDLPRLIGRSTTQFIANAKQSPNECDASELTDFVSRRIILALYFDQPKILPAGIPSGVSRNFESLLSKNSFVGIAVSVVKKMLQYPEVNLSRLCSLVNSYVKCWENFPGKPYQLTEFIKENIEKFFPCSTLLQNIDLENNILRSDHCGITVTKKPVVPNYFSSSFPSKAYLTMLNKESLSNCSDDKDCVQDSTTASLCVALSSSMPADERRDLIDRLPRRTAKFSQIISVSGSPSHEAEQYSIEICRNKKVLYILACVVRQVRPNGMKVGIAIDAIDKNLKELMKANSSKRTISVRNLLAGLIGDQSFLTPVCLVIINGVVFLINFGPNIKIDMLRPSTFGRYMKFGLVAEQALGHPF